MRRILILIAWLLIPSFVSAQTTRRDTVCLSALKSSNEIENAILITPGMDITGMTCKMDSDSALESISIIAAGDTIRLKADIERGEEDGFISSELVVFREKVSSFKVMTPSGIDTLIFFYINASMPGPAKNNEAVKKKVAGGCSEPAMIDQAVWRINLPAPDYIREVHQVKNIIIHHSAGQIYSNNYYEVVRSIYLYHTGDRGWSDIGYNYLIANDGSLFKGRDPGEYEQDNVKGAHFCNSNTGTMGICIIGTYDTVSPSTEAYSSLIDLLSWKITRDDLNPLGTNYHVLNPSLPVIAGHRDGCATECPGQTFYTMFPAIRQEVHDCVLLCPEWDPTGTNSFTCEDEMITLYPNPANNNIYIHYNNTKLKILVIDMAGIVHQVHIVNQEQDLLTLEIEELPQGTYIILLQNNDRVIRKEFCKY